MDISSSDDPSKQIGESPSNLIPPEMSPDQLATLIGSPLTPTANIDISTPQEPSRRRALIDIFDPITCFEEAEEAECYDSDGNGPPSVDESQFKHFELSLDEDLAPNNVVISESSKFVFLSDGAIDQLKVDELRQELTKRSLSKAGLKAELRERLKKAMVDKIPVVDVAKSSSGPEGFDKGCRWNVLEPSSAVEEPSCEDPTLLDPSSTKYAQANGITSVNKVIKMNYETKFDREKFVGEAFQPSRSLSTTSSNSNKKRKQVKPFESKSIKYVKKPTSGKLLPNIKFTQKHRLDENSHPADWLRSLVPDVPPKGNQQSFSKKQLCQFTNMKAELDCAGNNNQDGLGYKFVNFTPSEIEQHLALYIIQGLNPSPQLAMKAKPNSMEPLQGNDLISSKLGSNFERRHRQFRRYFACQHPYKPVPPVSTHPNWKVDPFLHHLNLVFIQAAVLPEKLSVDEQTIMFHGSSKLKSRIKYKKTGDGFQCDSICSDGYTATFFFRHQHAPKKYLEKGFSPLHSRIMFMFDQLKNQHHSVYMDNLYMSATFARNAIQSKNKVKIHGVTRTDNRGIPKCILQTEMQNQKIADEIRNTVKVAVLNVDKTVKDLVAISFYDSKPVYFLSTVIPEVKWTKINKKIYSKNLNRKVVLPFLRPNFVDEYNQDMNSVDRADQLRTNYSVGRGLRQRKWWWSVFLWGLDVAIVNAYLLYKSWYEMHGLKPMSHYFFREKIALAWLDEEQYWPRRYSRRPKSNNKPDSKSKKVHVSSSASSARVTRSVASSTLSTTGTVKVCRVLNQNSLNNGNFDKRLILSNEYTHLPAPALSKHSECQLHKWSDKRTRKQVAYCADCQVSLCIQCYKVFHTVVDLRRVKNDIQNEREVCIIASKAEESPLSEMTSV